MEAVAAPRPEADPVTIAHKPSLDIRFLLLFCSHFRGLAYHIARQSQGQSPLDGIRPAMRRHIPAAQAALLPALVRPMAFPHHKAQDKTAPGPGGTAGPSANQHRGAPWRRVRTLSSRPRKRFSPTSPM